ncbi:ROK family transcriptional regulator [Actinomadura madurae]|uniref:ROK family transcriptional regulator n=1 Tax=Actinomadura madurae TaxID=1993 RepID=UPI002025BA7E|nr:ROK family transcriptional regulator [Actinomadura madurae]MCQ0012222.1 ROK family transcriptional regulator [Actinomadura madurae]URM92897.1 ROK family transcriptional regulator [Actinomadura madurae]URN03624.1 ROK family transcriptional regulator [Actinomadura madurae]
MTKSPKGPVRHATMRERNLAVVLEHVARHQPVTRARLAELTGFTKTTVSNLVALLEGAGLVRDGAPVHEGERGRPGVGVSVHGGGAAGLGLEVNVDYLAACVLDLAKQVRYRHVASADNRGREPAAVLAALSALADEAVAAAAGQGLAVAGAAVALPGMLDRENGVVRHAPNLGWADVPVAGAPGLATALPAEYDNEANLAALGELWFGGGARLGDFVHVSGEIGIGAGIVVDGRVFRGAHGFAGELGHLVADPSGPACSCGGRGCLEQIAGQEALLRAAGLPVTRPAAGPGGSVGRLVARLDAGDEAALAAVTGAGRALGAALASVVNLLDPDTIVLGGVFSPLAAWVRPPLRAVLAEGSGSLRRGAPPIEVSGLAEGAAVLGAAGLVVERVIADPALLL